jgi:hypothetical protein
MASVSCERRTDHLWVLIPQLIEVAPFSGPVTALLRSFTNTASAGGAINEVPLRPALTQVTGRRAGNSVLRDETQS